MGILGYQNYQLNQKLKLQEVKPTTTDISVVQMGTKNELTTFISEKTEFSFDHPNNWPIFTCPAIQTYQPNYEYEYNGNKLVENGVTVESIHFSDECILNATSQSFGYIYVTYTPDYIPDRASYLDKIKGDFTTVTPKDFGDNKVYVLSGSSNTDTHGDLLAPSPNEKYYIFRDQEANGTLIYSMALTNSTYLNWAEDDAIDAFNQILSTFQFIECSQDSDCQEGFFCDKSYLCPKGADLSTCTTTGSLTCVQKCESDSDCPSQKKCIEYKHDRGDISEFKNGCQ